jgi:hypothetical protein
LVRFGVPGEFWEKSINSKLIINKRILNMIGIAGLPQILACEAGTLATTHLGAVAMGFSKGRELKITDFRNDTAWPNIKLRNMKNFAVQGESMQPTMSCLDKTFSFLTAVQICR